MTGLVTLRDLCIDANDPQRVGEFWAALLGREPADAGSGDGLTPDVVLRASPDSSGPTIWVNGVPEPKAGKTRIHLDVDLREGRGIEDLLALGAVVLGSPESARWWVLADPEGNEFCAFLPEGIATNDAEAEVPVVDVELPSDLLDLTADPVALTAALVDVPSVSGSEEPLADLVQEALDRLPHLSVVRDGNNLIARTELGRGRRVLLAGHLDTVPIAGNVPSRLDGDRLYGCGTSDMKSGDAVLLHLAATLPDPSYDLTFVLYDNEEVEADKNGLKHLVEARRGLLEADLAVLMEPTSGQVEAGCQGTLRVRVTVPGRRAHSARGWLGENAIHGAAPLLTTLVAYDARSVDIDGCVYREGLNAVRIDGGVAGNVIPDECTVLVNFRFAPDRSEQQAYDHVREVLGDCELVDSAPGALPGLSAPAAQHFIDAIGTVPVAKYGWTDVARFAGLGIPAVNFGPGDPNLAHTREEHVEVARITAAERALRSYLTA